MTPSTKIFTASARSRAALVLLPELAEVRNLFHARPGLRMQRGHDA